MKNSLGIAVLAAAVALTGCAKKENANVDPNTLVVTIGHAAPLTGSQAHLGKDNENGARLAIDELNAQGLTIGGKKVRFELKSEDDQADPRQATTVAQRFIDAKVNGIIGHLNSGTSIPTASIYARAGLPQISPSATSLQYTAQGYKTTFRVMANDGQQGKVLGQYAIEDMKAKRIAIIDDRTAYGQGLADEFEKAVKASGATVVAREFTSDQANDFTAILTAIKGKQPDLLFFGGMDPQAAPMVKQMKALGLSAPFLGGDGVHTDQFLRVAGANGDGVTASLPGLPVDKMPRGPEFQQKFTPKYGRIELYAPYVYDAVMVMADAMKRANSVDPAKYLPELAKTSYDGVTAKISFDGKGDLASGAITVYRVTNGQWQPMKTIGGAAAPAPVTAATAK